MKKQSTNRGELPQKRRVILYGIIAALSILLATWSVVTATRQNEQFVQPPTAADMLKSIERMDQQMEELRNNPNIPPDARERTMRMLVGYRARLLSQYERLQAAPP